MADRKTSSRKAATTKPKSAARIGDKAANTAQPEGEHTHLATPTEEAQMRKEATKSDAVKQALAEGKKDPIAKWGENNPNQEIATRRANFG